MKIWRILAFVSFGLTVLFMAVALWFQQTRGIALSGRWIFLGGSLFVGFGTMHDLKAGRVHLRSVEYARKDAPGEFWIQITIRFVVAIAFIVGAVMV